MYKTNYAAILDAETADAPEFLVKDRSARAETRKNRKYQMRRRLRNMYTWSVPAEEWYEVEKAREKGENAEKCIGRLKGALAKRVLVGTSRKYYYFDDIGMRQFLNYRPCEMRKLNECEDQLKDEDAWDIAKKKKRMFMQAGKRDLKKMYRISTNGSINQEKYNITDFRGVPDYEPICYSSRYSRYNDITEPVCIIDTDADDLTLAKDLYDSEGKLKNRIAELWALTGKLEELETKIRSTIGFCGHEKLDREKEKLEMKIKSIRDEANALSDRIDAISNIRTRTAIPE